MSFAQDKTVALGQVGLCRINVQHRVKQRHQDVRDREVTTDVTNSGSVYRCDELAADMEADVMQRLGPLLLRCTGEGGPALAPLHNTRQVGHQWRGNRGLIYCLHIYSVVIEYTKV